MTNCEIMIIKGTEKRYVGHMNSIEGIRDIIHFLKTNDHTGLQVICLMDGYAGAIVTVDEIIELIDRITAQLEQISQLYNLLSGLSRSYLN